jgi:LPXTG-motif cell wall-anchored protein
MRRIRNFVWAAAVIVAVLVLPAVAAASPRTHQYTNPISNETAPAQQPQQQQQSGGVAGTAATVHASTLPFTGQELTGIVIAGFAILATGTLIVARTRRRNE